MKININLKREEEPFMESRENITEPLDLNWTSEADTRPGQIKPCSGGSMSDPGGGGCDSGCVIGCCCIIIIKTD